MNYIEQKLGYSPLLILDDGHGMETAGKRTPKFADGTFIHENEFNRVVINLIEKDAQRLGFKTLQVAPTDADTPLRERSNKANEAYKKYKEELKTKGINITNKIVAIYYSQHYNAMLETWDGSTAEGVSTHYYPNSVEGERLAECVHKYISTGTPQKNRKIVASNFHVLRETDMPSVLSEAGFMDDLEEAKLMLDVNFQKETATQALQGICEYFGIEYEEEKKEQPKTYPTLRKGSKGEYVKALQQKLKDLGYTISVDGDFGAKTEAVVKQFQKDNNLVDDGIAGKNTWKTLETAKPIIKDTPKEEEKSTNIVKHKYYKIASTHIVEVDPLALKISVQDKSANTINLSNFVTSGFQVEQAEKTNLPMYPNSDATIQMGKYKCYPLGILVSNGKVIQNRQPHNKPSGTLIVYRDGKVECKPVLNILQETDFKNVWFAVSGVSILPDILMKQEGFTGLFSDVGRITSRPVIGYNPEKNKIIIAVRPLSNINRGKETLMNLGCTMGISLDAGGSTILRVDGRTYMNTTRRLFSVITW